MDYGICTDIARLRCRVNEFRTLFVGISVASPFSNDEKDDETERIAVVVVDPEYKYFVLSYRDHLFHDNAQMIWQSDENSQKFRSFDDKLCMNAIKISKHLFYFQDYQIRARKKQSTR